MATVTVVVDGALAVVTNRVSGMGGTIPKYIGWGTGAGVAAKTDTDLFTPATEPRVRGTVSRVTTTKPNDTLRVVGLISIIGSTKTITNAGLFDSAGSGSPPSGGNLCAKSSFTGVSRVLGDSIEFTFDIPVVD
jgi:hypothetical protein